MKTTKITPSVKTKIAGFVSFYNGFSVSTKKLSDLYSARSTNYASIYNSDLFLINKTEAEIVASGYSKLCKAVITLNLENPLVVTVIEDLKKENELKNKAEEKAAILLAQQKTEAKIWIENNPEIVRKEAVKVCEKFGRPFTSVNEMSSKMLQQLAWFLLKYFTDNSKTAIFHAL